MIQIISCRARLVTKLKTWLYHYEPETSNSHWSGGIAPHLTPKFPSAKIGWKSSRLEFWDQDGILLIDYTSQQDFGTRKVYCVSKVTFHAESKYAIQMFPSPTVFVQWPF